MMFLFKPEVQRTGLQEKKIDINPGLLRLKKDLESLDPPQNIKINPPSDSTDDKSQLTFDLSPNKESLWYGGKYHFNVKVPYDYPHEPPKITCETKIYHPNIDLEGNVCLNILRADWRPVFNINTIAIGINQLFEDPNPTDPLNREAGTIMSNDFNQFKEIVRKTLKGMSYQGQYFKKFI